MRENIVSDNKNIVQRKAYMDRMSLVWLNPIKLAVPQKSQPYPIRNINSKNPARSILIASYTFTHPWPHHIFSVCRLFGVHLKSNEKCRSIVISTWNWCSLCAILQWIHHNSQALIHSHVLQLEFIGIDIVICDYCHLMPPPPPLFTTPLFSLL